MKTHLRQPARAAFTLIEVMLAMGIFAMVLTAIYTSWTSVNRGARIGMTAAADAQRQRMTRKVIEDALSSCVMFSDTISNYTMQLDSSGDFAAMSFVSRLPESFPGSAMFGGLNLRRVTFWVAPDTNGVNRLYMSQYPPLLATNGILQPYVLPLGKDISAFGVEVWDSTEKEFVTELTSSNQVPTLVRVTLGFGHDERQRGQPAEWAVSLVNLPSTVVTADMQNPSMGVAAVQTGIRPNPGGNPNGNGSGRGNGQNGPGGPNGGRGFGPGGGQGGGGPGGGGPFGPGGRPNGPPGPGRPGGNPGVPPRPGR